MLALALIALLAQDTVPTFGTTVVINSGLKGLIYHIGHNSQHLPNFAKLKPKGAIYTTSLNVPPRDFKDGFPGVTKRDEWFAIDYTGRFWIETPGLYRFSLMSDDGAKLYTDDQLIVDNDGQHPPETKMGSVQLAGGVHSIRISYFQGPKYHVALVLMVASPGEDYRVFNTDDFTPPTGADSSVVPGK